MIKDITIGQYFPGKSFLHSLDARDKLCLTFAFIVMIFVCKNFFSLAVMLLLALLMSLLSRIPARTILKSFRPILPIIILTSALQLYYNDSGTVWFEYWKFKLTSGGVFTAIFMAVRICTLILVSSLLTYTTSPTLLTDAIERLLSPLKIFKVKVHTLAMMMTIALRFIPTLIDEIDRIMSAQKARGADFETGSLITRARALIPIFVPLFVSSFKRAYELAFAMECRCYRGGEGRTRMRKMKFSWRDYAAIAFFCGCFAAVIYLNISFEHLI
ncbi:MAG: energy-coupling factor transporter transmembrane protein EcfT [Clostridiales bacterium]|nr:energy-coupling factor transporter transmembrane protein EcfT [Clostridiales bacterium]